MNRTWVIAELLDSFRCGETWTAPEVAELYGVTVRSAQRWLREIEAHATIRMVTVDGERPYRWGKEGRTLTPMPNWLTCDATFDGGT